MKATRHFRFYIHLRSYDEIAALTKKIHDEWGILVLQDLVLNHTGNNTTWLCDNPQCLYNLVNSPHLKPA